jgi:DNA-binding MarR family transcriptional regulator
MDRVPDCRIADIAVALSITVGGVSKLVDRIEHAGWCCRAPNPNDARSSVVTLSRAGQRVLDAAQCSFGDELPRSGSELPSHPSGSLHSPPPCETCETTSPTSKKVHDDQSPHFDAGCGARPPDALQIREVPGPFLGPATF